MKAHKICYRVTLSSKQRRAIKRLLDGQARGTEEASADEIREWYMRYGHDKDYLIEQVAAGLVD